LSSWIHTKIHDGKLRQLFVVFFIIPLDPYGHYFPFSSCTSMRSNKLAPFLTSFVIDFFFFVSLMLLILVPHVSPLHSFYIIKLFHLYSIFIVISLSYVNVVVLFSLVYHFGVIILSSMVSSLVTLFLCCCFRSSS